MDVLNFINSEAIREHLRKINYKFNSLEAVFIVWQDRTHTLKQKHEAFEHIINTMPDCRVPERSWTDEYESLHQMLQRYMEIENEIILAIKENEENVVYSFQVVYEECDYNFDERLFYDYTQCFEAARQDIDCIKYIQITKQWINTDKHKYMSMKILPDGEVLQVGDGDCSFINDIHILSVFEGMWFEFPVPFQKGDILYVKKEDYEALSPKGTEPFVLEGICYNILDEKHIENAKRNGDLSDMTAYGYFLNEDGKLYHECMHDYFSLEYYKEELTGANRILKALSNYIKGRIDITLLMNAYSIILKEKGVKKHRTQLGATDEELKLAGLNEDLTDG